MPLKEYTINFLRYHLAIYVIEDTLRDRSFMVTLDRQRIRMRIYLSVVQGAYFKHYFSYNSKRISVFLRFLSKLIIK